MKGGKENAILRWRILFNEDSTFDLGDDNLSEGVETLEGDQLIVEAVLEDVGGNILDEDAQVLVSEALLSERSIVRLDKFAKRSQAEDKAVIVLAKENKDPLYKKLVLNYKQRRDIKSKLRTKYGARAKSRVQKNISNSRVSNIVAKTAANVKPKSVFKSTDMPTPKRL